MNADFARLPAEMQKDYWVRKELIRQYRSNDPEVGYTRWPAE